MKSKKRKRKRKNTEAATPTHPPSPSLTAPLPLPFLSPKLYQCAVGDVGRRWAWSRIDQEMARADKGKKENIGERGS